MDDAKWMRVVTGASEGEDDAGDVVKPGVQLAKTRGGVGGALA